MATFEHIPHVERVVYKRTFLNEIALLFTYSPVVFEEILEDVKHVAESHSLPIVGNKESTIILNDGDALITVMNSATIVSLPSSEYKNFLSTALIWDHLEMILRSMKVIPIIWSFTKGDRIVFAKPIPEGKEDEIFKIVLSKDLIQKSGHDHIYVEESLDKSCVFTCRFGIERRKGKDSLSLKTMIASQCYTIENLREQVFEVNNLMFDCWHWCSSEDLKKLMNSEKN